MHTKYCPDKIWFNNQKYTYLALYLGLTKSNRVSELLLLQQSYT